MKPAQVRELFRRLQALNPHPVTELEHSTPFELLVAVILSAQATDKGVNVATRKLFPRRQHAGAHPGARRRRAHRLRAGPSACTRAR